MTFPSLRGVFVFIIITITIAAFQLFTQVWVMTNGGPDDATTTVVFNMVRKGFREQDIAMASAIGVLFFLFIIGYFPGAAICSPRQGGVINHDDTTNYSV